MTALSAPPQAPAFAGYHHLGITVRDVEASEAWYGRVLGFVRAFVEPHREGSGYAVVMTKPGTGLFLGLDHHADADGQLFAANRTGLDHIAFGLATREDLDAWVAHLDALGVDRDPVFEGNEPAPMALVVMRDPDGIPLELIWFAG
jgi:glyoxylase I family protein